MNEAQQAKYLQWALLGVGAIFLFGIYPLSIVWPAGWTWHHGRSEYLEMIIALYATLGGFLLLASRKPGQHVSLISFTIWSSVAHGGVMAVQAIANPAHIGHLLGDVPALFLVAALLAWLCPRAFKLQFTPLSA